LLFYYVSKVRTEHGMQAVTQVKLKLMTTAVTDQEGENLDDFLVVFDTGTRFGIDAHGSFEDMEQLLYAAVKKCSVLAFTQALEVKNQVHAEIHSNQGGQANVHELRSHQGFLSNKVSRTDEEPFLELDQSDRSCFSRRSAWCYPVPDRQPWPSMRSRPTGRQPSWA
jgi:hypothetical protein